MLEEIIKRLKEVSHEEDYGGEYECETVITLDDAIDIVTRALKGDKSNGE